MRFVTFGWNRFIKIHHIFIAFTIDSDRKCRLRISLTLEKWQNHRSEALCYNRGDRSRSFHLLKASIGLGKRGLNTSLPRCLHPAPIPGRLASAVCLFSRAPSGLDAFSLYEHAAWLPSNTLFRQIYSTYSIFLDAINLSQLEILLFDGFQKLSSHTEFLMLLNIPTVG